VVVVLGADLAVVESVVCRSDVIYDEAPLVRPLSVVDADARVAHEPMQTDRQRMNVVMTTPSHLQTRRSSFDKNNDNANNVLPQYRAKETVNYRSHH